jgi:hypothetical protein
MVPDTGGRWERGLTAEVVGLQPTAVGRHGLALAGDEVLPVDLGQEAHDVVEATPRVLARHTTRHPFRGRDTTYHTASHSPQPASLIKPRDKKSTASPSAEARDTMGRQVASCPVTCNLSQVQDPG